MRLKDIKCHILVSLKDNDIYTDKHIRTYTDNAVTGCKPYILWARNITSSKEWLKSVTSIHVHCICIMEAKLLTVPVELSR